jgi:hypothetical protein
LIRSMFYCHERWEGVEEEDAGERNKRKERIKK